MSRVDELRDKVVDGWCQYGNTHAMERELDQLIEAARQDERQRCKAIVRKQYAECICSIEADAFPCPQCIQATVIEGSL